MLDFRYHVASLVAVFLALTVGILVGVGISGRGFVDKSERRKVQNRIDRLQSRLDELSSENDSLRTAQLSDRAFVTDAYAVLMHDRLSGKRVAVIVVGAGAGSTGHDVQQTLADAVTSLPATGRSSSLCRRPPCAGRSAGTEGRRGCPTSGTSSRRSGRRAAELPWPTR